MITNTPQAIDQVLFENAQQSIYNLMVTDNFSRFVKSEIYYLMRKKLKGYKQSA